jgi:hypothetical protein
MRRLIRQWARTLCFGTFLCFGISCATAQQAIESRDLEFFEKRIRPVLVGECYECHSGEKPKGGLRLDFRAGVHSGGDSGAALDFTDPDQSLLVRSIRHADPDLKMPKNGPRLDARVVQDFVEWIRQGAPDPRDAPSVASDPESVWQDVLKSRSRWWSFQPLQNPGEPPVSSWSPHPVDRFLHARMKEKALEPAPPTGRRALLRRVSFALTGLPPRQEEIDLFLSDESPDAFEKLVDRLLASPRFGERWARHWMDLVRYAETHGSEGDPEIPEIWRYRNYLVRAFNEDIGADQLIHEHLAGDLLPDPRWNQNERLNESLLGISHFRLVEHGFQPVDTLDEQVKVIDSQVDVIFKAFQGLTVSCARCHDHKFDPISQRDFFAVYGVLSSVRPTQRTIDHPEDLREQRDALERLKKKIRDGFADLWTQTAKELPERLLELLPDNESAMPERAAQERIRELDTAIHQLQSQAGAALFGPDRKAPLPFAAWTFDDDASDLLGSMHGMLKGGARVRNGRLILDGKGAFVQTSPLTRTLTEKTLEAWVLLPGVEQRGGGVLTVETPEAEFDAIVFGERQPRQWIAGSDFFRRTREVGGPMETSDRLVHIAIVYRGDHSIALFRDGVPYGKPYRPPGDRGTLRTFPAENARVLLGLRHTGASNGYLNGEIEEARLYGRALTDTEIRSSFEAGPLASGTRDSFQEQRRLNEPELSRLLNELQELHERVAEQFPGWPARAAARAQLLKAVEEAATQANHPLHPWARLQKSSSFPESWRQVERAVQEQSVLPNATSIRFNEGGEGWFLLGINPPEQLAPGEFDIAPSGAAVLSSLWPAGIFSHRLSRRHNGVLISPRFKVTTDSISVRVLGGGGARVRLIPDDYPLGSGNIFPQAELSGESMAWIRLDTAYRKGTWAHLEFAPAAELLARNRPAPPADGRSWFGVEAVIFHDGKERPGEPVAFRPVMEGGLPGSLEVLARGYGERIALAVANWRDQKLSPDEQLFLNALVRSGILPGQPPFGSALDSDVQAYRNLENSVPIPRRAPGVVETTPMDAPLMHRGDHHRLLDPVPRAFLEVFGGKRFYTDSSGRLDLALELTSPKNPLTARVMVNRIWHHLFGRGIVPTVDNFGRLGETPTHPELLDYLAQRFIDEGWSFKRLIRFLVTSQAYRMASDPSERAREIDPANDAWSHMRLRRLEAEAIRDSLLAISGRLDERMFGPPAAPPEHLPQRRSIYLPLRRNSLNPFLELFDAPKPFSTLGRRDATNVPGQSLALLNDPFVISCARQWARRVIEREPDPARRIELMFETAFARLPTARERELSAAYLAEWHRQHADSEEESIWSDLAHSLFNLKEFIYIP